MHIYKIIYKKYMIHKKAHFQQTTQNNKTQNGKSNIKHNFCNGFMDTSFLY